MKRRIIPAARGASRPPARRSPWGAVLAAAIVLAAGPLHASDHADPIDPFNKERLEGGITDLFIFPVLEDGSPAFPFERTDGISLAAPDLKPRPPLTNEQRAKITHMMVIFCVRRALTETGSLHLDPYTYRIHMDQNASISFDDTPADAPAPPSPGEGYAGPADTGPRPTGAEARARYGGLIANPGSIRDDVLIEFALNNDASLRDVRVVRGLRGDLQIRREGGLVPDRLTVWTGVRDDPFIFPAFFRTNVVAMVLSIPMSAFAEGQTDWLIWGTSHRGDRQLDHVGRSLRSQNPRFDMFNTLPPSRHVAAVMEEHEHPGLIRDLALRFNFQSMFAYRRWDFVPDVMVFTTKHGVGFPNGRLLTDDVAALLAQHGDTLLLELSHHVGGWPRRTSNDKEFQKTFPYLADPWEDRPAPAPPRLSDASWMKIVAIVLGSLALFALWSWLFARWYHRRKLRTRYL